MRLLIVDDCLEIVNILSSILELSGHETHKALNGLEATELLRKDFYDIVITDAEMPGMDGMELCRWIKSRFPGTYIIGTSGSLSSIDRLGAAGADLCFSKPFRICEIEKAIQNKFILPPDLGATPGLCASCRLSGCRFKAVSSFPEEADDFRCKETIFRTHRANPLEGDFCEAVRRR